MAIGGREIRMAEVKVRDNESLDNARRFKRKCQRSEFYQKLGKENTMKNQVFVKKKSEVARRRKYK